MNSPQTQVSFMYKGLKVLYGTNLGIPAVGEKISVWAQDDGKYIPFRVADVHRKYRTDQDVQVIVTVETVHE